MRVTPTAIQLVGAALFALAILHTFATGLFQHLATTRPKHAGVWHLLGEVEVVFGFWAFVLVALMFAIDGADGATEYVDSRSFIEPMFVFVIMVIAGTRPVLQTAMTCVRLAARVVPLRGSLGIYIVVMTLVPLLGSLITEPAAMTLGALILADRLYSRKISTRLKYASLGVLFVNVSIGGTLTSYAAPPVLMVADAWGWDSRFMIATFGWKAVIAVALNAVVSGMLFRKALGGLSTTSGNRDSTAPVPASLACIHLAILAGVVVFAHHPVFFMGLFVIFLGVAHAYRRHEDPLILREALLVAFFLAGLVVLGGQQQWWLEPTLQWMSSDAVFVGATILTAFTDNAALTYLGSRIPGLSDAFKYALMTGAVTGGGLTIIANAPNPAGVAILRAYFDEGTVRPTGLLLGALPPTIVAALAFMLL